jgi:predicted MFS family arabinose efflux permease
MTGPSPLSRAAWAVVGLLWVVALLNYLDRQLVASMGPAIKDDLKIQDGQFGLFSSVFLWVYGLCSPFAGYVADRVGRRPVIVCSLLIWSAATFVTGFATSFEGLLAARAALGVSEAFYMPAAVALIVDYHQGSTRARATGLHLSGVYVGSVLGGLGGWLADDFGWRFGFLLFGGVGVGYALVLMIVLPVPPGEVRSEPVTDIDDGPEHEPDAAPPPDTSDGAFRALLTTPGFVLLLCMNALNGAAYWPLRNWLPVFFHDEFKVPKTNAGLYGTSTFNAAAFVGMLLGSTASDWWAKRTPRARVLVPAVGFCLAAPCLFALGSTAAIPVMIGCVLAAGMSQGFLDANLMPAACTVCAPRHRATAYGLLNFVGTTAGGIMTYVGGVLKDQNVSFGATFQAGAVCILAAGLLLFAVRPRTS